MYFSINKDNTLRFKSQEHRSVSFGVFGATIKAGKYLDGTEEYKFIVSVLEKKTLSYAQRSALDRAR